MADVGVEKNFVDTQGISLTNDSDAKTYKQLTNVSFDVDSNVRKHQLTDGQVDNVFSLFMNYIQADITLTTTELGDLITLTRDVAGVRPIKLWSVSMNDSDNQTTNISFSGQVKTLRVIDAGISVTKIFLRIEGREALGVS